MFGAVEEEDERDDEADEDDLVISPKNVYS
jgi:hypothetical protein